MLWFDAAVAVGDNGAGDSGGDDDGVRVDGRLLAGRHNTGLPVTERHRADVPRNATHGHV